jgi:hypothetical protein
VAHPDPYHVPNNGYAENDWREGQDVKWVWADPYGSIIPDPALPSSSLKSFGMNNLNYGNAKYTANFVNTDTTTYPRGTCSLFWHSRHMPEDGTYCVIDEFKISNKDLVMMDKNDNLDNPDVWRDDRVVREMFTSRYYLPPSPGTRLDPSAGGPPTFTSQTLLHSLKGLNVQQGAQNVAVVRVSWDVFTPRFMCEYKLVLRPR